MPLSSTEVALQTMGSLISDYLKKIKSFLAITKDGMNQLVNEQFPHCKKKEISPGVYEIRIPLIDSISKSHLIRGSFSGETSLTTKNLKQEKRDDATYQDFEGQVDFPGAEGDFRMLIGLERHDDADFPDILGFPEGDAEVDFDVFVRFVNILP